MVPNSIAAARKLQMRLHRDFVHVVRLGKLLEAVELDQGGRLAATRVLDELEPAVNWRWDAVTEPFTRNSLQFSKNILITLLQEN